ncbi:MAG: hypothetical protein KVP17_004136 [Porospora cf. gigantea B]|uniref:uncharacterized protein n=1 Tax=Porospora cf. gigantea B TaxID=2853592 RepID=UPI0035719156|nr:MAG: hypothetical protein KVP17_004136 [Porospora cf. gigantea B]
MWIALTLLALTAISTNGVSTELDLPAGVAASESREVDVEDELLREDYFDEHVGPQIKSPLLDRIHRLEDQPLLSELRWVPELLSLVHAFMSCCFYGLLMAKVRLDRTVFGISIQTILAMTVTEVMMATLNAYFLIRYRRHSQSFLLIDLPSVALAVCALWSVLSHRRSYEEQYDTWGLNVLNYVLYFLGDPAVDLDECRKAAHMGHVRPRGPVGRYLLQCYWLVLYVAVLPLATAFFLVRTYLRSASFDEAVVSYTDALRAVALMPQVYMFFAKKGRRLSEQLGLMVFFEFLNRWVALLYWVCLPLFYDRKTMKMRGYNLVVQLINISLLSQFGYWYIKEKLATNKGLERVKLLWLPVSNPQ